MALIVDKEIEWLTNCVLPEILKNGRLVDNYNESQFNTFKVGTIQIAVIGIEEAFMLTQCYRASINFDFAGKQQQVKLVVKKTPEISTEDYNDAQFDDLFHNEVVFYTEILPLIQQLSGGNFGAPKYYYSEIKSNSALIILGDFATDGWSVTKDRFNLSLEHVRIAVKYLGKFHGFGYAMKNNENKRFQQLTKEFRESRFTSDSMNPMWDLTLKTGLKRALKATNKYHPDVDMDFVKKFQQLVFSYVGYGRQRVAPKEPFSTICHGDYLRNNVAYKYDTDSSGNPLDIMMFDYQTVRLSSPMIDLSVFLACSVFADVRYKHFDSIFDDYCNALFESYTKQSNQPLPEFLNRQNMLNEYVRFLPYSISISSSFLMMLVDPPQNTPAELFLMQTTEEDIINNCMTQGGEIVDREIAHQLKEMFDLSRLHNVEIDEDIDSSAWINSVVLE
ncbi:uncharacterized protein LOC116804965 [Drosophila grimshawi]|uniref:uncharacterized protein LOC116804965 n=1 Tax=Drosophila grimshawi TaxID=7222 RepID=UPI000C86E780|nr:uncharacterized protein LOC116804965 [Drosophila grimshawi]